MSCCYRVSELPPMHMHKRMMSIECWATTTIENDESSWFKVMKWGKHSLTHWTNKFWSQRTWRSAANGNGTFNARCRADDVFYVMTRYERNEVGICSAAMVMHWMNKFACWVGAIMRLLVQPPSQANDLHSSDTISSSGLICEPAIVCLCGWAKVCLIQI